MAALNVIFCLKINKDRITSTYTVLPSRSVIQTFDQIWSALGLQCAHWPRYTDFSSVYRKSLKLGGGKQLSPLGTKKGYKTDENGWILSASGEILWWNS